MAPRPEVGLSLTYRAVHTNWSQLQWADEYTPYNLGPSNNGPMTAHRTSEILYLNAYVKLSFLKRDLKKIKS